MSLRHRDLPGTATEANARMRHVLNVGMKLGHGGTHASPSLSLGAQVAVMSVEKEERDYSP